MKHEKRLGSVIQTAVALLLCLATVLCVTQLQTGRAPQEEAHAASRMLLSQGEVLYDGDRIAGMDSANDGEDQENDTPDEPDMPEEPDTPEDQQTVQDQTPEDDRQDGRQDTQTPDKDDPSSGDGTTSEGRGNIDDILDIVDNGGGSGGQIPDRTPLTPSLSRRSKIPRPTSPPVSPTARRWKRNLWFLDSPADHP